MFRAANLGAIGLKEIFLAPFGLDKKEKYPLAFSPTSSGGLRQEFWSMVSGISENPTTWL